MSLNRKILFLSLVGLSCAQFTIAAIVSTSYQTAGKYPYDYLSKSDQPQAAQTVYRPYMTGFDSTCWGWQCVVDGVNGLRFGGNQLLGMDAALPTHVLKLGVWTRIDSTLRSNNALQQHQDSVLIIRNSLKDFLARARRVFFEGRTPTDESLYITDSLTSPLSGTDAALVRTAARLRSLSGLSSYEQNQALWAAARLDSAASLLEPLSSSITSVALTQFRKVQVIIETAADALGAEPPARALSIITYDTLTKLFVVFAGDHFDYLTNDLWVFDPSVPRWMQRHPLSAPSPRADHWLLPLGNGLVKMKGGLTYATGSLGYVHVGPIEWTYDVVNNTWVVENGGASSAPDIRLYRSSPQTPEYFMDGSKPSASANSSVLAAMPTNTWVDMAPPFKSSVNRDWGTAVYDSARDQAYIYAGGHSAYPGTDVLHYHLATNRYEQTIPTDVYLGRSGANEGLPGWSFNKRPWMSGHTWNSNEFHSGLGKMALIGRQHGSMLRDRYIYFYNPDRAEWEERITGGTMDNDAYNVQACYTSIGMLNWTGTSIWRMNDSTRLWTKITTVGTLPGSVVDNCGIAYDAKRNRVLMFTCGGYGKPYDGKVYGMDLTSFVITPLTPANASTVTGIHRLREVAYMPETDAFLFLDTNTLGTGNHLVYNPTDNQWMMAKLGGICDYGVSSGLFRDSRRNLYWHFNNTKGTVRVLKIDTATLELSPLVVTSVEKREQSIELGIAITTLSFSGKTNITISGLRGDTRNWSLAVYDVQGRLIADMSSRLREMRNSSTAVFPFDFSGMASRIYVVRLKAGSIIKSSHCVVMH